MWGTYGPQRMLKLKSQLPFLRMIFYSWNLSKNILIDAWPNKYVFNQLKKEANKQNMLPGQSTDESAALSTYRPGGSWPRSWWGRGEPWPGVLAADHFPLSLTVCSLEKRWEGQFIVLDIYRSLFNLLFPPTTSDFWKNLVQRTYVRWF